MEVVVGLEPQMYPKSQISQPIQVD